MIRKILLAVFIVLIVVGALVGTKGLQISALVEGAKKMVPLPEAVSTAVVESQNWQVSLKAIATVSAVQGVTVTPDIPGTVREIRFESGAMVQQGDLLVRLDTSSEKAQLEAVEAEVDLAKLNLGRVQRLRTQDTVSQADLDAAEAAVKQGQANAEAIRATIEKKHIRAPFAGKLGIRQVNLGQYLESGKPIVSLQAPAPVYADFSLPQQDLPKLSPGMTVILKVDAYPGRKFEGTLTAINPDLNPSTRSAKLQATFTNADAALRPGMFARAEVLLPEQQKVFVVPATAILSAPFGDSVYLVEPGTNAAGGLVARQKFVKTGRSEGDFISVLAGLEAGNKVVSAGAFKLRNGVAVVENNELSPKTTATPRPSDS